MKENIYFNKEHLNLTDSLTSIIDGVEQNNSEERITGYASKEFVEGIKNELETSRSNYEKYRTLAKVAKEEYDSNVKKTKSFIRGFKNVLYSLFGVQSAKLAEFGVSTIKR